MEAVLWSNTPSEPVVFFEKMVYNVDKEKEKEAAL